jgi:branched-chain amino acid transport system ATP-binding protein
VLEVAEVTQVFGGITALDDVSIWLGPGRVHGIIGPNGAGKTTLFDIISGVRRPTRGRISFETRDITSLSAVRRARMGIRRTFQRQQPIGWLSVEDNVVAAMDWQGGGGGTAADMLGLPSRKRLEASRRSRAGDMLELCGLTEVASTLAGGLTIGQARMLELARALVDAPKVLLLDEPTSGLDSDGAAKVSRIIETACGSGCAVALVEHDVSFVTAVCDEITVLALGEVLATGTPTAIVGDPEVQRAYLGEVTHIGTLDNVGDCTALGPGGH